MLLLQQLSDCFSNRLFSADDEMSSVSLFCCKLEWQICELRMWNHLCALEVEKREGDLKEEKYYGLDSASCMLD